MTSRRMINTIFLTTITFRGLKTEPTPTREAFLQHVGPSLFTFRCFDIRLLGSGSPLLFVSYLDIGILLSRTAAGTGLLAMLVGKQKPKSPFCVVFSFWRVYRRFLQGERSSFKWCWKGVGFILSGAYDWSQRICQCIIINFNS